MNHKLLSCFLFVFAALLFIPFLGEVPLFDWDEVNFAESAREMIVSGDYQKVQIDFHAFWEKPPLFFWMQTASMNMFGVNEFAARLPNAICGILTVLLLFRIGKRLHQNTLLPLLWILAYVGSFLSHFYFKSGIIDPWYNLMIFSSLYFMLLYLNEGNRLQYLLISGLAAGLSILIKGPVGMLVFGLSLFIYLSVCKKWKYLRLKHIGLWLLCVLLVSFVWFGVEVYRSGLVFLKQFIAYQWTLFSTPESGHGGPWYYHLVVLLVGCFPMSMFIFFSGNEKSKSELWVQFKKMMWILLLVVVILFSIVQTKIVHYSSLAYFPLSYLAALGMHRLIEQGRSINKFYLTGILLIGLMWSGLLLALPWLGMNTQKVIPYIDDAFAVGNLQAQVPWHWTELTLGLFYLVSIVCSVYLLNKTASISKGIVVLFLSTLFVIQVLSIHFVPKIEKYTQHAAIEFYRSLQGKNVYVEVLGFRSYAHYFYSNKQPLANSEAYQKKWLLHGHIDKPAYFVCKNFDKELWLHDQPELKVLYEKNGFVFFLRPIPK